MADRTARFSNWFQIISNVAIIVGLALIVYELDQSKKVANGQMIDAAASRSNDLLLAMMGEDPRVQTSRDGVVVVVLVTSLMH